MQATFLYGKTFNRQLHDLLGATAPVITLKRSGSSQGEILDLCKNYWNNMAENTCVFIHMESTTTSFGFILRGSMGSWRSRGSTKVGIKR